MSAPRLVLTAAALYAIYCALLYVFQRHLIFPALFVGTPPFSPPSTPMERLWVDIPGGRVEGWLLLSPTAEGQRKPLVIFAHGNGELIDIWPQTFEGLTRRNLHVLLLEYPGYGRSTGKPTQHTITRAFCAAYDRLITRPDVDPSRIVFMGRSIGGGAACALAAQRPSAALVLLSTFTSLRPFAVRYLAPSFLIRDPFDNHTVVSSYPGPVLIVHGKHDAVVPYGHGKALAQAARRGRFITYDADHNDCPPDWEAFFDALTAFLREVHVI
ncbi:MAG: alpha/beta hydrolase [Desulfosoma sp.]